MIKNIENLKEYVGAIHIHSTYSDGSRPIPEIWEIAKDTGLDFIVMTDHYTLQPLRDSLEGWHDGILVLIGYEVADKNNDNHFLILDVEEEVAPKKADAEEYVAATKKKGGIGIIAHPDEVRTHPKYRPYPWKYWDTDDFTGIEIWNYMSEWMEILTDYTQIYNYFFPDSRIKFACKKTVERWDELNQKRFVPAIGGIDVHEKHHKFMGLFTILIFPYEKLFRRIRNHILTTENFIKNVEKDREIVYNCIVKGSSFISNYYRGDAQGFRFYCKKEEKIYSIGSKITLDGKNLDFYTKLPLSASVHLIKDGKIITKEDKTKNFNYTINQPGVYRIEAFRKGGAWIYSNPIIVL